MSDLFSPFVRASHDLSRRLVEEASKPEDRETLPILLREVRAFDEGHVDPARIDRDGKIGEAVLSGLAERGLFGLTIPEEFGGAALSLKAATRVVTELAGHNGSVGTCVGLHSGLALYSLIHLGTKEARERYLPEVAAGTRLAAFAATEPSAGSDISAVKTTLAEVDGKLVLNGTKSYVTNGGLCGVLTALAKSPGLGGAKAGHTMVVVDPSWPGVRRQGEEHKLGLKGSSTITIDFDDVVIPADHVVGEPSKGLEYAHRALTWGRTFMAAGCLGTAKSALAEAREHTSVRQQFGRPLAKFPLVRGSLARMQAEIYAIESVIRLVCDLYDTDTADIALPSTVAKIASSEAAWNVVDRGLQLMGGAGFIEEAGMPRRLRDTRVTRIFEGANDVLRLHLASAALGWPMAELRAIASVEAHPAIEAEARALDGRIAAFVTELGAVKKTWGFRLFEKQELQWHMADAMVAMWSSLAVALRVRHALETDRASEVPVARLAMRILDERAERAIASMAKPVDKETDALIDQLSANS